MTMPGAIRANEKRIFLFSGLSRSCAMVKPGSPAELVCRFHDYCYTLPAANACTAEPVTLSFGSQSMQ